MAAEEKNAENEKWEFPQILTITDKQNLCVFVKMKLVYNFYSSFKCSKSKMASKFGQKIVSDTKSTDVPFLSVV